MNRGRWLNALIVGATLLVFLSLAGAIVGGVAWGWTATDHGSTTTSSADYVPDVEPEPEPPAPDPGVSYRYAAIPGLPRRGAEPAVPGVPAAHYWLPGRGTWCRYADSYIDPADGWRVCP